MHKPGYVLRVPAANTHQAADICRAYHKQAVRRGDAQMVGVSCMWVAAKYEEHCAPSSQLMVGLTDDTYTTQVRDTEQLYLTSEFRVLASTRCCILGRGECA